VRSLIEDARGTNWRLATAFAVSILAAVILGESVTVSRSRAVTVVYLAIALAAVARFGILGLALLIVATLPWLVVAGDLLPRLTETFAAGAAMALALLVVAPRKDGTNAHFLLRVGIVCFYAPVLISLQRQGSSDQFIQGAKYIVFPAMVFAVIEGTNHRSLIALRTVALWSSIAAVGLNLFFGLAGLNVTTHNRGSYHAGEILGYAGEHDLALLAGCVTAATIVAATSWKWASASAVGAIATVATGVRSTLPGLGVLLLAKMFTAGARIRTMLLVGLLVAAVFVSGAAHVVEARFQRGQSLGEFNSFTASGSGRGAIYTVAIDSWRASSPIDWVVGTGLRSIPRFEQEKLGSALVGHSDVIEVGVQLGIVGLAGYLLIWWVLIARARSKAPLLVLASFALFNGALEYSAPLVIALLLTSQTKPDWKPPGERAKSWLPARPTPSAGL
jgi:O-antigen ligase